MKIIFIILLIFLSNSILANEENNSEVEVINLHESKSLDQMVLDQISSDQEITNDFIDEDQKSEEGEIFSENSSVTDENLDEEVEIKNNLWSEINYEFFFFICRHNR